MENLAQPVIIKEYEPNPIKIIKKKIFIFNEEKKKIFQIKNPIINDKKGPKKKKKKVE